MLVYYIRTVIPF